MVLMTAGGKHDRQGQQVHVPGLLDYRDGGYEQWDDGRLLEGTPGYEVCQLTHRHTLDRSLHTWRRLPPDWSDGSHGDAGSPLPMYDIKRVASRPFSTVQKLPKLLASA